MTTKRKPETLEQAMDGIEAETKIGPKTLIRWDVLRAIVAMIGRAGANTRKDVDARFRAMEKRLAEVETRGLKFRGAYQRADEYRQGDAVVHAGTLWIATQATRETPGKGAHWQMTVKTK